MTMRPVYQKYLCDKYSTIAALNDEWGTSYKYFWEMPSRRRSPPGQAGELWEEFVQEALPMRYVHLDVEKAGPSYTEYLRTSAAPSRSTTA